MGKRTKVTRWRRSGDFCTHHIQNRVRKPKGVNRLSNLLTLDENRERAWHFIFNDLSFEEVAALLLRTVRAKKNQEKLAS